MDLVTNALVSLSVTRDLSIFVASQGVEVLLVTDFLFLLLDADSSQILLELALIHSVIILNILQRDLSFFFELRQLVEVLENQMLASLLVYLLLYLMLFSQVLQFALFVSQFCLFVF